MGTPRCLAQGTLAATRHVLYVVILLAAYPEINKFLSRGRLFTVRKRIVVACPAYAVTGGPELLHQLCYVLRDHGFDSIMYYTGARQNEEYKVPSAYEVYHNPYILSYVDSSNDILVIPETMLPLCDIFHKCAKVFWWLSVDNFYRGNVFLWERIERKIYRIIHRNDFCDVFDEMQRKRNGKGIFYFLTKLAYDKKATKIKTENLLHLNQSYYSMDSCKKLGIPDKKNLYLSDYLNCDFIKSAISTDFTKKENIVLYNPRKGFSFTKKIIDNAPDLQWIPLTGLTREEMIALLQRAKVYIDFGNHPGKDRIPREAAICGCCVITGKRGSAYYHNDVPIPDQYKFDDEDTSVPFVVNKIHEVLSDYDSVIDDFREYREFIKSEEDKFIQDAVNIFSKIVAE